MKKPAVILLLLLAGTWMRLYAQTDPVRENVIERLVETISENNEENEIDYTALLEDLNYFYDHPLNLNAATREQLQQLYLLTDYQITSLFNYRRKYGQLNSIYEIQNIDGWDADVIYLARPFITVAPVTQIQKIRAKTVWKYGKHEVVARYAQYFEKQKGYLQNDTNPSSGYLGDPFVMMLRYRFTYRDRISIGFAADKDRGEEFFRGSNAKGFDFYSGHIFFKDFGIFKKLVLGDYQVQFGQGLTMWSGFSFGKTAFPLNIKRFPVGIRPYAAINEFNFNRGAAAELQFGPVHITSFFSAKQIDGNLSQVDTILNESLEFTSFQETGLHRTQAEIADRNAVLELMGGGNVSYRGKKWNIGATAVYTYYNKNLVRSDALYNKYMFQGDRLFNAGVDYNLLLGKFYLFGELSFSQNGGYALTQGIQANFSGNFGLALMYRDFSRDYQSRYTAAFAERMGTQNERGFYLGFDAVPFRRAKMQGYFDVFQFPWLRFNVSAPSWGYEWLFQLTYVPARKVETYIRVRGTNRQENSQIDDDYIDPVIDIHRVNYRLNFTYEATRWLKFRNRVEFVTYDRPDRNSQWGFMIYQDIIFKPEKIPLDVSARIALFHTDGYDTRIYAYENDVLYAFSVPAYYYKGMRYYINLKYDIVRGLSVWLRLSQSYFYDRQVIGSGLDEIRGNTRTEIKVQVRWRFSAAQLSTKKPVTE